MNVGDEKDRTNTEATPKAAPAPPPPVIHEAELASGPSGAVLRGNPIDEAAAVARRKAGADIVVCGEDTAANRSLAQKVEAQVGVPSRPQFPHTATAGPAALPHLH